MEGFGSGAGLKLGRTMVPYSTSERAGQAPGSPMQRCPACGSDLLDEVVRGPDTRFRCQECGRCWMCRFAGVFRMNPVQCPGCAHRGTCFELLREDFAGWWSLPGLYPAALDVEP